LTPITHKETLPPSARRTSMVRQFHIVTVGLVFLFLGAIVLGVF
jgi:hypothetical protein